VSHTTVAGDSNVVGCQRFRTFRKHHDPSERGEPLTKDTASHPATP